MKDIKTVKDLIVELKKHPKDTVVRVLASCCGHPHDIRSVREPREYVPGGKVVFEAEDGTGLIIDATG